MFPYCFLVKSMHLVQHVAIQQQNKEVPELVKVSEHVTFTSLFLCCP